MSIERARLSGVEAKRAMCMDGSLPAYYWRDGIGPDRRKVVVFLEGMGWCGTSADCQARVESTDQTFKGSASSRGYPEHACVGEYEGSAGLLSPLRDVSAWSTWAAAIFKYCDGGMWTGT